MAADNNNVYQTNGYKNREDYLSSLAAEFSFSHEQIYYFADLLGETEDFDGLVTALEDFADYSEE
jgi:hypothetical protein